MDKRKETYINQCYTITFDELLEKFGIEQPENGTVNIHVQSTSKGERFVHVIVRTGTVEDE